MKKNFSHLTKNGEPTMVDVSDKGVSHRIAIARSMVILAPEILEQFQKDEIHTKKGPVFQTAILAGIMASKKTRRRGLYFKPPYWLGSWLLKKPVS